jgi:hypothetical protein
MNRIVVFFPRSKEKKAWAAYTPSAAHNILELIHEWRYSDSVELHEMGKAWVHFDNAATGEHAWYYDHYMKVLTIIMKELELGYLDNNHP